VAEQTASPSRGLVKTRLSLAIVLVLVAWTYLYNLLIKEQGPIKAFFGIMDTISDDFVVGAILTIGVGLGIVAVFSITKLYTQIIADVHSFRMIEELILKCLTERRVREFFSKLLNFQELPRPEGLCPTRIWSLLFSFVFIYVMSWIYVVLFSEALFFVSWSAGVDLEINAKNLLFMPTLALAIPFSARVMAYMRYPYAQDYADFMPGAVFVLLVVAALGQLFESDDQVYFLLRVFSETENTIVFLKNGVLLAFIPVFFEAMFWLRELNREAAAFENAAGIDDAPAAAPAIETAP